MDKRSEAEMRLWHLLLGAMLVSKEVRLQAFKSVPTEDVPTELTELWRCLFSGDGIGVRQIATGWHVEDRGKETVISSVIRKLQQEGLAAFVKRSTARVEFSAKGLTPEEFVNTCDMLANRVRARQATIAEAGPESKKEG